MVSADIDDLDSLIKAFKVHTQLCSSVFRY